MAIFWVVQSGTTTLIYAMLFAILIITSVHWTMPDWMKRGIKCLDKYSYTIYLIQGLVFDTIIDRYWMSQGMIILIAVLGTFIESVIVYNMIEKPIQKLLLKMGNKLCLRKS